MKYVKQITTQTLEVKQSKFIAYLLPFTEYEKTLQQLKKEHPKARHFVVAYRHYNEFKQITEHSSDDGEPKGTSGKPTLFVLQGAELINTAIIIVRYFGGTKLGTGGLVRAYSDAANLVINNADILEYKEEVSKQIQFEYSNIRMIEYESEQHNLQIVEKSYEMNTIYTLKGSKKAMDQFLEKVGMIVEIKKV